MSRKREGKGKIVKEESLVRRGETSVLCGGQTSRKVRKKSAQVTGIVGECASKRRQKSI